MHRIKVKLTAIHSATLLFVLLSLLLNPSNLFASGDPLVGVYAGTTTGVSCENGVFNAIVEDDGTFNLLYHNDEGVGVNDFLANFVKEGEVIAPDGSFSFSADVADGETVITFSMNGTFTATGVSGSYSHSLGCVGTFSGSKTPLIGPLLRAGGYYSGTVTGNVRLDGVPNGTFSGTVSAVVAADGSGMMVHNVVFIIPGEPDDPLTIGGPITLDPGGNFSEILDDVTVTGSIDTTNFTGSGTTFGVFLEPEGTFVESGNFTIARQFSLHVPYNDVVANLPGTGVSVLLNDNTTSTVLHPDTAEALVVADVDNNLMDDVIVSFPAGTGPDGNGGTYISRNEGPLVSLDPKTAEEIAAGDFDGNGQDDLFLDFGVDGLSTYMNDTVVSPLTPESPLTMAVGDIDNSGQDDVVLSFAAFGTVVFRNFASATVLDSSPANVLEVADIDGNGEDDIAAGFAAGNGSGGTGGLFIARNQGALTLLTPLQALQVTSGDFDASGECDLVFDFGGATGLVIYLNDASGMFLTNLSPLAMASGDVDSSGQDDLILSFAGIGTVAFKDLTTVEIIDPVAAVDLDTGSIGEPSLASTLEFSDEALDLETGAIFDCSIIFNCDTGGPDDFSFAFNALSANPIVLFQNQSTLTQIAFLDGVPFEDVSAATVGGLTFTTSLISQPFDFDDTIVLITAEGNTFKIGRAVNNSPTSFSVTFEYKKL